MSRTYFITGTDTSVGKTHIAAGLLYAAAAQGLTTAALKPVASGCQLTAEGLRNEDALLLQSVMTESLEYAQINPIALAPAIAPHLAAQQIRKVLSVDRLMGFCRGVGQAAELVLIEGAGGWRVPINPSETLADLAKALNKPVIVVVAIRLGCINHALLTCEAILRDGLPLAGWVANIIEPEMPVLAENIQSLVARIPAPLLGVIPHIEGALTPERVAEHFDGQALQQLFGR